MTLKSKKRGTIGVAELSRQLASSKLENDQQKEQVNMLVERLESMEATMKTVPAVSLLGERWEKVLGEVARGEPIYYLEGDDDDSSLGSIAEWGKDPMMYQIYIKKNEKVAYFPFLEDAAEQGERWTRPESRAIDHPVLTRNTFETEEQTIGQDNDRPMKATGAARDSLEAAGFEVVDKPMNLGKEEALAFNEEELVVMVHDSDNEKEMPLPIVQNGGISQAFIRGQEQVVKRKFVEILARCKVTSYTQTKETDSVGNETMINHPHTKLLYSFSVIQDPNPRGRDWLQKLLQEK